jgi:hypothetical protein
MIIVGLTSFSEPAIRSITKLKSGGYRVEFTDRPSQTVFDIPGRSEIVPAGPGFELWVADPDAESFDRYTVTGWLHLIELDGKLIGRPEPVCAAGVVGDEFPRAHCLVIDSNAGQAWGLGFGLDDYPTADLESLTREILDKARADRAPKRRAA